MSLIRRIYRSINVPSPSKSYYELLPNEELALLAGGCFWGMESMFRRSFETGIIDIFCVYTGDKTFPHPIYDNLGRHVEAILIKFDCTVTTFRDLVTFFFSIHDPTQRNGQGPDLGRQYSSLVYTFSQTQVRVANQVRNGVSLHYRTKVNGSLCVTRILPAHIPDIWIAERRHQRYLDKNPSGYECPSHYKRDILL